MSHTRLRTRAARRLHTAWHTRLRRMSDRDVREGGFGTLEALTLAGVILLAAAAFTLAFNGALDGLIAEFESAVGK
ncbi:hypothetical protein [Streptomyces cavernicola]|uniref:Flp family type IVb pilin n=1 Tax=Streptomyces cavernicola TaxID=3043613 RepID=A0ABT6SLR8_9ACTN|nr:hypothetical protein [Streptomyces sp. B-S-A6]MDI3408353.1 hypothetical protein [Streptomyces sp. B-S-A6]